MVSSFLGMPDILGIPFLYIVIGVFGFIIVASMFRVGGGSSTPIIAVVIIGFLVFSGYGAYTPTTQPVEGNNTYVQNDTIQIEYEQIYEDSEIDMSWDILDDGGLLD